MGGNPKSKTIQTCLTSGKAPAGLQIIEWNEDKLDLNANKYVKQAYQAKKWAFVSDYVRAKALCGQDLPGHRCHGLKDFAALLNDRAFMALKTMTAGIIAAERGILYG